MLTTMNTYHYRIDEACVVLCSCQMYDTAISNILRLWLFLREFLQSIYGHNITETLSNSCSEIFIIVTFYLLLKLKQVTVEMLLQSLISKVYAQLLKTVFLVPFPRVVRFSYKCQKEYQYIHVGAENMSLQYKHNSENFDLSDTVDPVVAETLNDTYECGRCIKLVFDPLTNHQHHLVTPQGEASYQEAPNNFRTEFKFWAK